MAARWYAVGALALHVDLMHFGPKTLMVFDLDGVSGVVKLSASARVLVRGTAVLTIMPLAMLLVQMTEMRGSLAVSAMVVAVLLRCYGQTSLLCST